MNNMNNMTTINTRASISQEEKDKSTEFINLLNGLMEIVFNVADKIDDNEYLVMCNNLRDLYKLKPDDNVAEALATRLEQTEVVMENRRRAVMRVRTKKTEIVDDYEKIKSGHYKRCPDCSRVIANTYFTRHKKNGVCIKTNATKKLSAECGEINTTRQEDLICKITGIKNKKSNRNGAGSSTE
jgi:hypothetical protein